MATPAPPGVSTRLDCWCIWVMGVVWLCCRSYRTSLSNPLQFYSSLTHTEHAPSFLLCKCEHLSPITSDPKPLSHPYQVPPPLSPLKPKVKPCNSHSSYLDQAEPPSISAMKKAEAQLEKESALLMLRSSAIVAVPVPLLVPKFRARHPCFSVVTCRDLVLLVKSRQRGTPGLQQLK